MMREHGYKLLARLGKTSLSPGGEAATSWLLNHIEISEDVRLLEVAGYMGSGLTRLAESYDIELVDVVSDPEALKRLEAQLKESGHIDRVTLFEADALNLPFDDGSFDYVLSEAILTMLSDEKKADALKEYYRVLKPGGVLLSHDMLLADYFPQIIKRLQKVISAPANPLMLDSWIDLYKNAGFNDITYISDAITLFSDEGLEADEGVEGKRRFLKNAKADHNYLQFMDMRKFFNNNKDLLHYIAFKCNK